MNVDVSHIFLVKLKSLNLTKPKTWTWWYETDNGKSYSRLSSGVNEVVLSVKKTRLLFSSYLKNELWYSCRCWFYYFNGCIALLLWLKIKIMGNPCSYLQVYVFILYIVFLQLTLKRYKIMLGVWRPRHLLVFSFGLFYLIIVEDNSRVCIIYTILYYSYKYIVVLSF
jgi:hypothetical protein